MQHTLRVSTLCITLITLFTINTFGQASHVPTGCSTSNFLVSPGDRFYDDGGAGGCLCSDGCANNYANANCTTLVTLCPAGGSGNVQVQFTELAMWNTTSTWDWLEIYDNNAWSGPMLFDNGPGGPDVPYGDCGTDPLFTVTATNPSGCLYMRFWATSVVNRSGWQANLDVVGVLPVEFSEFSGKKIGERHKLVWKTASEENNQYFIIERSNDNQTYTELARVSGTNSSHEMNYEIWDEKPLAGINYYRIKQVDYNGEHQYSNTINIRNEATHFEVNDVYPNPLRGEGVISLTSRGNEQIQLEIFNMMGQRVKQDQITSKEGLNQISFDLTSHDPGVYILKINNGVEKYTKKIILQ